MAGCGTLIIPPLDRPSDNSVGFSVPSVWGTDALNNWAWVPVQVPQYNPPTIGDLALGAQPPAVPDIPFDSVDAPYRAGDTNISVPVFDPAPVLDATAPNIYEPSQPEDFTGVRPGDAPDISDVTVPDTPVVAVPDAPTVSDVVVPDPITLDLPTFNTALPDSSDIFAPGNTFNFTEEEYTSDVLTNTQSEILRMLQGGVGIPDTTWQLILSQGIEREEQGGNKLIEEAATDFASRGWSAPGGVLDKRIREARQGVHTARNTLARETTIKEADMELENLKISISQGIALETVLINLHNSAQDRGLEAAKLGVTIAIQLMEAKISIYNSELSAYQISADVYKSLIEAEMTKVQTYKAEIEASMLTIEVDKARIDAYNAQIKGLSLVVELHNSQVRAILAQVEVETARIEAYKSRVQAYAEDVRAWSLEWDGYKAAWSGQMSKADIYKSRVQAYAAEVSGYESKSKVEEIKIDAEVNTITLDIERMKSDTTRFAAEVQYQAERTEAIARTYSSQMDGYNAITASDRNRISVFESKLNGDIANARAMSAAAIENARIVASQLEAIQRLNLSAYETEAQIEAQIEASRLGQFNSSTSMGSSFGTNYSYNCDS